MTDAPPGTGRAAPEAADVDALERAGSIAKAADAARSLAGRADGPAERSRWLLRAAELASEIDGAAAEPLLAEALEASRAAGRRDIEALALAEGARLALAARDPRALRRAGKTLDAAARTAGAGHPEVACRVEHYRGLLAARRGEPAAAVTHLRRAYGAADGDASQRARILNSWGLQLEAWGDPDEARRLLERSLELKLELEDLYGTAATYGTLAFLHVRCGAFAEARDALARDLEISERIGAVGLLPGLHARMAGALVGMGRIGGAEREALRAIELAGPSPGVPAARAVGFAWREIARVRQAQGRLDEAIEAARDRSLAAFESLRDPYGSALARLTLAAIHADRLASGDRSAADCAREALAAARSAFARLGAVHELAECLLLAARIHMAAGDARGAVEVVRDRVLPLIERMARGAPHLRRAALDLLHAADPRAAGDRVEVLAGMRRTETAIADRAGGTLRCTVVAAAASAADAPARVARAAAAEGGILVWVPPDRAVVLLAHEDAGKRAAALGRRLRKLPTAVATGEVLLVAPWPAPPLASGPAVNAALRALAGVARRAGAGGRRCPPGRARVRVGKPRR